MYAYDDIMISSHIFALFLIDHSHIFFEFKDSRKIILLYLRNLFRLELDRNLILLTSVKYKLILVLVINAHAEISYD